MREVISTCDICHKQLGDDDIETPLGGLRKTLKDYQVVQLVIPTEWAEKDIISGLQGTYDEVEWLACPACTLKLAIKAMLNTYSTVTIQAIMDAAIAEKDTLNDNHEEHGQPAADTELQRAGAPGNPEGGNV
jgi:hypothetical protein